MKIGHPKDFWGGVLFAVIGLLFALIAYGLKIGGTVLIPGYAMGVPARMGPAFFPFWLGTILFFLGVIIAVGGFRHEGPEEHFPRFHWKPNFFVLGAVLLFGIVLKAVGMLLAGIMLVMIAGFGSHEFSLKRSLILAVVLVIFCALVFVAGLKLPIPLCPDIESLQSAIGFCRA
jgi:hypothetical protein